MEISQLFFVVKRMDEGRYTHTNKIIKKTESSENLLLTYVKQVRTVQRVPITLKHHQLYSCFNEAFNYDPILTLSYILSYT